MAKNTIILERRFVPAGTTLMKEGDEANCAYLIQSGLLGVYSEYQGQTIELARLGVGEICGEMALFNEERRTANVKVLEDCNLIIISRQTLLEKLERSDPTIRAVVDMLIKRLVSGNLVVTNKKGNVEDLADMANIMYQNVAESLTEKDRVKFKKNVFPLMTEFIEKLESFRKKAKK
ncbi:MAG: cyclic nucleotide-binding domain-containing protein [Rhodospirillales bacterium]|nr:cyclic nucleotide-binding domain-containing protein [Alphaproteobacteria bacterium]MCB9976047.1 cyclic nucleotide-binding domain-containing protein [Rhodospirillales bacterium]